MRRGASSAPLAQSENTRGVRDGSSSVERFRFIPDRGSLGGRVSEKSSDNGSTDASLSGWGAVNEYIGVDGSLSGPETFSPILGRVSCSGQDRQHDGGGIYQLPRGNTFIAIPQSCAQTDCLGHCVQRTYQGVLNVGADLLSRGNLWGDVRQGCHRSLRFAGKRKVSAVFLSQGRKCAFGCGCAGTPLTERVAIRLRGNCTLL